MKELKINELTRRGYYNVFNLGKGHICALHHKGFVLCIGNDTYGQCRTEDWFGIKQLDCGDHHTVGSDGKRVLAVGDNYFGQCNIPPTRKVQAIACGSNHTLVLYKNGSVYAFGDNRCGQCNISHSKKIIKISAYGNLTVCIDVENTAFFCGEHIALEGVGDPMIHDVKSVYACKQYILIVGTDDTLRWLGKIPYALTQEMTCQVINTGEVLQISCVDEATLFLYKNKTPKLYTQKFVACLNEMCGAQYAQMVIGNNKSELDIVYLSEFGEIKEIFFKIQ